MDKRDSQGLDKFTRADDLFTRGVWVQEWPGGVRLQGVSIKVKWGEYLVILKGVSAEGPMVAFMGASSLLKLVDSLGTPQGRDAVRWRPDKFRLDE
jgi:hypothetical protein